MDTTLTKAEHPTYAFYYSLLLCYARGFIPQAKPSSIFKYGHRFDQVLGIQPLHPTFVSSLLVTS